MFQLRPSLQPSLSKAIRDCRVTVGLTADAFAERLGQPVSFVQQIEKAELSIDRKRLRTCAEALGVSSDELLDIAWSGYEELVVLQHSN